LQLLENIEPSRISELSLVDLVWHILALQTIGYPTDAPELTICEETLEELVDVDEAAGLAHPRFRNGTHADSAIAIRSLVESGMSPSHPAIKEGLDSSCHAAETTSALSTNDACNWIEGLRRCATDLAIDSPLPPDIDVRWDWQYKDGEAKQIADIWLAGIDSEIASFVEKLLKEQNLDGGWGAMQSSESHVSGTALESLAGNADANVQTALNRGVDFLRLLQLGDGSWAKSDGRQQILCTSSAIRGLSAAGVSANDDCIAAAINWLVVQQHPSGGWKRSATQTAWAVLGLIAAGKSDHPAVRRGIEFLLNSQNDDGGWVDRKAVFQDPESNHRFRNDLHSTCWPLLALSRFAVAASSAQPAGANEASLRLIAASAEF
jgi:squalene-hopene/tetraprenyl-beta-curcumene cyclase